MVMQAESDLTNARVQRPLTRADKASLAFVRALQVSICLILQYPGQCTHCRGCQLIRGSLPADERIPAAALTAQGMFGTAPAADVTAQLAGRS